MLGVLRKHIVAVPFLHTNLGPARKLLLHQIRTRMKDSSSLSGTSSQTLLPRMVIVISFRIHRLRTLQRESRRERQREMIRRRIAQNDVRINKMWPPHCFVLHFVSGEVWTSVVEGGHGAFGVCIVH